jgi:hypothetical protein
MSLSITVTAGKRFTSTELVDNAKLNQMAVPTATLSGSTDTNQIGNDSVTAAKAAFGAWFLCADSGTANAHVLAASGHTINAYATGLLVRYKVNAGPNTGSTTANLASLGAKKLYKLGGIEVQAGDVRASQMVELVYDTALDSAAGGWWLLSPIGNAPTWDRYATTGGTATAYTATFSPTVTALTNGLRVLVKWNATNTGTATFAPDGLTAKAIRKLNDAAIVAGDILQDQISELVYDSTLDHWLLTSPVVINTPATVVGLSRGLVIQSNATDPTFKVDIAADDIVLKNSGGLSYLAEAVSLTANMSVSGANGLDTGAESSSTWYYLWAIYNGTTVAALISASTTSPTLPTGYTYKALLGAIYNDSGSNLRNVLQYGRDVWIDDTVVFTAKTGVTSYTALSGADLTAMQTCVPPMARSVRGTMGNLSSSALGMAVAADANGLGAQAMIGQNGIATDTFTTGAPFSGVPFKTAQTLYYKMTDTTASVYRLKVSGYTF